MNIEKAFKEKFCYEMMNFDHTNRHHYIRPDVVEKPQLIIDWIQQQVSVEPEVKVNFAEDEKQLLKSLVMLQLLRVQHSIDDDIFSVSDEQQNLFTQQEKLKTILSKISA